MQGQIPPRRRVSRLRGTVLRYDVVSVVGPRARTRIVAKGQPFSVRLDAGATVDRLLHHAHLCDSVRLAQATTGKG